MRLTCPSCGAMHSVEALLADAGRPWAYADGCARKMFGVDSVRFCDADQLWRIVAALMVDRRRRAKAAPPGAA